VHSNFLAFALQLSLAKSTGRYTGLESHTSLKDFFSAHMLKDLSSDSENIVKPGKRALCLGPSLLLENG
jgi:hypothetical protein